MERCDVVVVGAGFAGLVAARELAATGLDVRVLEARDRVGGSTWYVPDAMAGVGLELGGTWVVPEQRHVWAEAERYAVGLTPPGQPPRPTWSDGGRVLDSLLPCAPDEYPDLERAVLRLLEDGRRLDPDRPLSDQGLEDLDVPVDLWADRAGLRGRPRDAVVAWLSGNSNAPAARVSTLDALRWLAAMDGSLWGMVRASVLGWTFTDGTAALARAIADDAVARGAVVSLGSPVHELHTQGGRVAVTHARGRIETERVVVTVPIGVLGDLRCSPPLDPAKLAVSRQNHAGQGAKLWVHATGVSPDLCGFGWRTTFDFVGAVHPTEHGTVLVCFAPDAARVDPTDLDDVQRAVRQLAPDAEVIEVVSHDWATDEHSRGTWATCRPGQVAAYERELGRAEGRLHFAGSHTGTRWRGFIDGALESGVRVAAEVRRALVPPVPAGTTHR